MPKIGFSTGCLHRTKLTMAEKIAFFKSVGANSIEFIFRSLSDLMNGNLSSAAQRVSENFNYVSIHAPWENIRYGADADTDAVIEKLKNLCGLLPIKGIVIHPRKIDGFEKLEKSKLPFLIENSGRGKPVGTLPEYFTRLKLNHSFGFVLDIQHAYEHDSSMRLAEELIEAMGDRLKEIHVSGHALPLNHVPTHLASNKDAIIEILKLKIPAPKILEGILFSEDIYKTAAEELSLVKSYEA